MVIVNFPNKQSLLSGSGQEEPGSAPRMNDDWASKGYQFGGWEEE